MAQHDAVSVGDKDVTVGRGDHIRWGIEHSRLVSGLTGFAERHEHLTVRRKLCDGVTFAVFAAPIGDPDIARSIDKKAVRPIDHAAAEIRNNLAVAIQFHHRIKRRSHAGVAAATLENPKCLAVAMVDFDANGRAELAPVRHLNGDVLHSVGIWRDVWIVFLLGFLLGLKQTAPGADNNERR
ncbi:MAG TPA: hypothetical protein VGH13_18360 [Xanthobacteraceae bacterium]